MKKIKLGLIAIIIIMSFASCEDMFRGAILEVELPEHESKLAPYAFFKDTDTVLTVMVGKSVGILDNENPDVVLDATVELYKNGNLEYTFVYNPLVFGYQVDLLGQPFAPNSGDEYELVVAKNGYETTSAKQIVPKKVTMANIEFKPGDSVNEFGEMVDVTNITFIDPSNEDNFYTFSGYIDAEYVSIDSSIFEGYSTTFYFESKDPNFENGVLTDVTFDGREYKITLESYSVIGGDVDNFIFSGRIEFASTTPEYATYIKSYNAYFDAESSLFPEPVILYSNMSQNLGVFGILMTEELIL